MIINAFAKIKQCSFFVSTHIIEVAEKLNKVDFKCFNSKLIDGKLSYDYKLNNGVSNERMGMQIIKNEHIVEILESIEEI